MLLAIRQVPRSASHALVVNTSSWVVYCFECNDEIQPEPGKALAEAVNFIRKSTGLGKLHKGVKKATGEKSEVENPRAALTSTSRTAFAGKVIPCWLSFARNFVIWASLILLLPFFDRWWSSRDWVTWEIPASSTRSFKTWIKRRLSNQFWQNLSNEDGNVGVWEQNDVKLSVASSQLRNMAMSPSAVSSVHLSLLWLIDVFFRSSGDFQKSSPSWLQRRGWNWVRRFRWWTATTDCDVFGGVPRSSARPRPRAPRWWPIDQCDG